MAQVLRSMGKGRTGAAAKPRGRRGRGEEARLRRFLARLAVSAIHLLTHPHSSTTSPFPSRDTPIAPRTAVFSLELLARGVPPQEVKEWAARAERRHQEEVYETITDEEEDPEDQKEEEDIVNQQ